MHFKQTVFFMLVLALVTSCGAIEGHKYLFTGEEGTAPPRTIEAAKANFKDSTLKIGSASESNLKTALGSASKIETNQGEKTYIYLVERLTQGISTDVGTKYTARYTFDKQGLLLFIDYSAEPMSNPLLLN